jgi:CxxC motif-containing protein (DUF1111 family)
MRALRSTTGTKIFSFVVVVLLLVCAASVDAASNAVDPGVRGGDPGAGGHLDGLTAREIEYFVVGLGDFSALEDVADGIGPRMNLDGCVGCHFHPAIGGSSGFVNPQVAFASKDGGADRIPFFITIDGPIREARFKYNPDGTRDGGVQNTATITGREGADFCVLAQPEFERESARNNLIFRIPTPLFGSGLIEQIPDASILANQAANSAAKKALGIRGRPNRTKPGRVTGETNNNGNDGTISRFGWKAQNQSLLLFSGEAYNVEMGITNPLFQQEREQEPICQFATVPNDIADPEITTTPAGLGAIEHFTFFQRFLAAPTPSPDTPGGKASIDNGRKLFSKIGCDLCHTPTLNTGNLSTTFATRNKDANLYSDILLHNMGPGLADDILQGQAQGDEFRTAPLWGLGQRVFFLHDGRTSDLLVAIQEHKSAGNRQFGPSEANAVVDRFNRLRENDKQDVLNFLRSL